MRVSSSVLVRPALAAMILLGLASTRSDASPLFTLTDLEGIDGSPSIPDSLLPLRQSNSSGQSFFNPSRPLGGPGSDIPVRAEIHDSEGRIIPIDPIDGDAGGSYFASAINTAGQVVGRGAVQGVDHGFLFTDHKTFDLNDLILPYPGAQWTISQALNIDDEGRILAYGTDRGATHFLLLEPTTVPEPTTLALFGLASAAALARARRRRS